MDKKIISPHCASGMDKGSSCVDIGIGTSAGQQQTIIATQHLASVLTGQFANA